MLAPGLLLLVCRQQRNLNPCELWPWKLQVVQLLLARSSILPPIKRFKPWADGSNSNNNSWHGISMSSEWVTRRPICGSRVAYVWHIYGSRVAYHWFTGGIKVMINQWRASGILKGTQQRTSEISSDTHWVPGEREKGKERWNAYHLSQNQKHCANIRHPQQ